MSTQGVMINTLRKEVQLKVLSNQERFNPDFNELISPTEIGELLKEYNVTSAKDLQTPQSIGEKLAGYLMPTSEVYPVASGGYRVKYTDGDEDFYNNKGEYDDRAEIDGKLFGQAAASVGILCSGIGVVGDIWNNIAAGKKAFGKFGALAGVLLGLSTYAFARASNSVNNDRNNMAQMDMIAKDKQYQAERQKQEEERRQADLEYKERLNAATSGIDNNLQNSESRVNRISTKLRKIDQTASEVADKLNAE